MDPMVMRRIKAQKVKKIKIYFILILIKIIDSELSLEYIDFLKYLLSIKFIFSMDQMMYNDIDLMIKLMLFSIIVSIEMVNLLL